MQSYEKEIAPMEAGWYAVCMKSAPDFHGDFPFCKPEVVWYDGESDHVCYDPKAKGGGGIQGLDSIAWWGESVMDKPKPELD